MSATRSLLDSVSRAWSKAPVLLFGPPAAGKTNIALWLAAQYLGGGGGKVHYICTEGRLPVEVVERYGLMSPNFLAATAIDSQHLLGLALRSLASGSGTLLIIDSVNSFYRAEVHEEVAGRRLTALMALLAHHSPKGVRSLVTAQIMERPDPAAVREYEVSGYWGIRPFVSAEIEIRRLPSGERVLLFSTRPSQIDQCYKAVIGHGGIAIDYCGSGDDEGLRTGDGG